MAEVQKRDLECIIVPNNTSNDNGSGSGSAKKKNTKKGARSRIKGLMMRRRKKNETQEEEDDNNNDDNNDDEGDNDNNSKKQRRIHVKRDSEMADFLNGSSFPSEFSYNPDNDLEYALLKSTNETDVGSQRKIEEEEELALATALSLSINEQRNNHLY